MAPPTPESARLSHLLRRAGFGVRPGELAKYTQLGWQGSLDQLLNPEKVPDNLAALLEQIGGDYVDEDDIGSLRHWWLYRMIHSHRPLEEKLTLFWHNHFATANFKVDNPRRMWRQNQTFRKYGLGSFRTLLQHMAQDPAMLVWLDGAQNHVGKPNENFAREVMELFTLGVDGGYTEADVKEAARAFTGWSVGDSATGFVYRPFLHDDGAKTVLGQTGNWHADDVIDILVRQRATATFLCTKLFKHFAHDNPTKADLAPLIAAYFGSGYQTRAVLRALFTGAAFNSPAARFTRIKSPVEFTVMTMRSLEAPMSAVKDLGGTVASMGQELFNPPNVKGWQEGRAWINSRTLLARVNFASTLSGEMSRRVSLLDRLRGFSAENAPPRSKFPELGASTGAAMGAPAMGAMDAPAMGAPAMGAMDAPAMGAMGAMDAAPAMGGGAANVSGAAAVETLWNALLPGMPLDERTRTALVEYAGGERDIGNKLPGLLNLIVAVPEYQLC